jgi:hypothetical protein
MLGDSAEAADTVAHEMWHAHQQQCDLDPASEKGREYQEGFDKYIRELLKTLFPTNFTVEK